MERIDAKEANRIALNTIENEYEHVLEEIFSKIREDSSFGYRKTSIEFNYNQKNQPSLHQLEILADSYFDKLGYESSVTILVDSCWLNIYW